MNCSNRVAAAFRTVQWPVIESGQMAAVDPTAHEHESWLPADLWILVAIFVAIIFIRPGDALLSSYAVRLYAVAFVRLLAVGGLRYGWL